MNTLQQYLEKNTGTELTSIFQDITSAVVEIAEAMRSMERDTAGGENVHGEKQLKLDVFANDVLVETLKINPNVAILASEEMEEAVEGKGSEGGFSVAFDPLDGSSLVDVNLAVGSIFGIYQGKGFIGKQGSQQVAAAIVVYGPRLSLILSVGKGVQEFLYHPQQQEFIQTQADLRLAEEYKMFAPGNLRASVTESWYRDLMLYWLQEKYTLRYSGGMVPDVNQILLKSGGVFTYPGYAEQPQGKLRLLYECAPMAFLIEQAGGKAISGLERILDIVIENLHQKTPIFLGSSKEVEKVREFGNFGRAIQPFQTGS